jgi:hypothetical protein
MRQSPVMNFMKQQGFAQEPPDRAALRFQGLQFQPMIVGGMAATFMLAAGFSLLRGWTAASYAFQGLIAVAFAALLFGKFCLGAYVYHLLKGNVAFANGTCPWSGST